jgi:hypothetical protein
MNAIVIATGRNANYPGLNDYLPSPLLPLGDRPFLQHIVEALARQKVRQFDFILSHLPEKIEAAFGDGARWGCKFRYHLVAEGRDPMQAARAAAASDAPVFLVDAETLPEVSVETLEPRTLIFANGRWTGWACLAPLDFTVVREDPSQSPETNGFQVIDSARCLSIVDGESFLGSQQQMLEQSFPDLMISGRQADPGVWISRNVSLHPSVKIAPPVYIGENCRIARGAQLGPSAVVGANCIVDSQTIVSRSMVGSGSYVGEGLELESVIIDRNRLLNVRLGAFFLVSETFLLGSLNEKNSGLWLQSLASRAAAFLLLLLLWPLLLLTWLYFSITRSASFAVKEAVELPAGDNPDAWRKIRILSWERKSSTAVTPQRPHRASEFFSRFLPGLLSVLRGHLYFTGVAPRTRQETSAMPADWRALYLSSKAGLITEAAVMFGQNPTEDELYTAEAFYSAAGSFKHDCKLIALWFWKLLVKPFDSGRAWMEEPQ